MQVPKQIIEFADHVRIEVTELSNLVAHYNELSEKKKKISEIADEYLRVQPLNAGECRMFLTQGIDVTLMEIKKLAEKKVDYIYNNISCKLPASID